MYRLAREDVNICFEDTGKGAPPLMFIHDLGCDRSSFAPQEGHFCRDHRVVTVDLRGHGQSDKPEDGYSMPQLAEDIAWLSYELGLYAPVVVGHGLGGMIALELAARYPTLPVAVVVLNSLLFPKPETSTFLHAFGSFAASLPDGACQTALGRLLSESFLPTGDLTFRRSVPGATALMPRHVALSAWNHALAWDGGGVIATCRIPILYIDAGTGSADLSRLSASRDRVTISCTSCPGHFFHLQHPDQANAMIDGFLASVKTPASNLA